MQQKVTAIINGGYRTHKTSMGMRARYRALGFRMPAKKYRVTYRLDLYGNLFYLGYPGSPITMPNIGTMRPLIIVNNRSVCFLPTEWDQKRLSRTVKVL